MRYSITAAVAALVSSAQAFSDSSPFILYSTAQVSAPENQAQLQSSSQVLSSAQQILSSCPTDRYVLVSQPNLNAGQHLASKAAVPQLASSLDDARASYSVAEVAGDLDLKDLARFIRDECALEGFAVDQVDLAPLPATDAAATLKENDNELGAILEQYKKDGSSYTVIYTGGARTNEPSTYEPEFEAGVRTELKRQLHNVRRQSNDTMKNLPLFEKYQYFTPGIFMGLVSLVVMLSILYAGVYAVASLEVSYGAFDKEMGPAAQKKQQ
ncbi:BIG/ATPase V1 complex, subunit S1 [Xylariomycetidae sp. FL0641]|nr:BIG/ATPase V1 complex, subunit S1 [Xylariomycetidae sp. FL0641]